MKAFLKTLVFLLLLSVLSAFCVFAAEDSVTVTVTVADGGLVLPAAEVTVTDADGDGVLSLCDALACAHAAHYPDGADGFAFEETVYGLSMTRLWGEENGGAYGYYLNHTSPGSLADPVTDGDRVDAFVYTDTEGWSDTYCFFDTDTVKAGEAVTLTLSAAGFDENWAPVTLPVAGATLFVDGEPTEFVTDENGTVSLPAEAVNGTIISAEKVGAVLVPPALRITAAEAEAEAETEAVETEAVEAEAVEAESVEAETAATEAVTAATEAVTAATEAVTAATEAVTAPQTSDAPVAAVLLLTVSAAVFFLYKKARRAV